MMEKQNKNKMHFIKILILNPEREEESYALYYIGATSIWPLCTEVHLSGKLK